MLHPEEDLLQYGRRWPGLPSLSRGARLTLLLIGIFAMIPQAHAEDAEKLARAHFRKGETYFATGRFAEALREYQAAYELKPLPGFLFNIGQCYRNLGQLEQAVFSFKRYLKLKPDAANRAAVEELITELEKQIEAQRATTPPQIQAPPGPGRETQLPSPPPSRPVYKRWWFWPSALAVAAGVGTGLYFLFKPRMEHPPHSTLGNIDFR